MIKVYEYYECWILRMGDILHLLNVGTKKKKNQPIHLLAYHLPLQK